MTNAEARFNKPLRQRKPEGSLGRTAQDVHLDSHTAPELCVMLLGVRGLIPPGVCGETAGRRVTVDRCVCLCCNKMTCCVRCVRTYTARCL